MRADISVDDTREPIPAARVPGLDEKGNTWILEKPTLSKRARLSSNSSSVSPGKPTKASVVNAMSGIQERRVSTTSIYLSGV
jgi:hypothetical protein